MTKLVISGILFSTVINAEVVAKPLILGILLSVSVILALQSVFLTSAPLLPIFFTFVTIYLTWPF